MATGERGGVQAWSDAVEDLVDKGDVDGAISLLESVVSKLETLIVSSPHCQLQLATALADLAGLHSSKGLSLKADELRSRTFLIRARALLPQPPSLGESNSVKEKVVLQEENGNASSSKQCQEEEDDWEAVADRAASSGEVLLSSLYENGAASDTLRVDELAGAPRRRGRGSFLYKKNGLYSDEVDDGVYTSGSEYEKTNIRPSEEDTGNVRNLRFGTSHVLVLHDFPPTTRTIQLENLFDKFRDLGVAIRWINDTVALAVLRTPSAAHEAHSTIHFPFKVRRLEEDDFLMTQISPKDLELPFPRPKTSARTAQRLIAHGMGFKPENSFGSNEFKKQEEARKTRILERQMMKDEAWGPDD